MSLSGSVASSVVRPSSRSREREELRDRRTCCVCVCVCEVKCMKYVCARGGVCDK